MLTLSAGAVGPAVAAVAVPTRPPLRTFPRVGALLILVAGLLFPGGSAAQSDSLPGLGADRVVGGEIRLSPGVSLIRGNGVPVLRTAAILHIAPWLSIGGEAVIPLSEARTADTTSPDRSELRLRYGGVRLGLRRPRLGNADPWTVALLVGTGTARVRSPLLATELGTDNFFVIEPAFERRFGTVGPVSVGGVAAYRIPIGAEGLPGVRANQLRGVSVSVSLAVGRNP